MDFADFMMGMIPGSIECGTKQENLSGINPVTGKIPGDYGVSTGDFRYISARQHRPLFP